MNLIRHFFLFCFVLGSFFVQGQEYSIELGQEEIGANQLFTITITVKNERIREYNDFPEITGFVKRGTSSSSRTEIINGSVSSSHSITMNYMPENKGDFELKPFAIEINGKKITSPGVNIKVGDPVQTARKSPYPNLYDHDPFDDMYGKKQEPEFVDVKDDAFLALTPSKSEVFVGEGLTVDLSFYVSDDNRAIMQFYDLGKQLSEILKVLKPGNCWEENFNIENINGEPITINGKNFTQYKIYEAVFYPFNTQPIEIPSVGLEMIKYKIAKNPSFFGTNRQQDYKTFYSKKKEIKVKPLPPHPLKDIVAVGDYKLDESLNLESVGTGESFKYDFTIYGEGNISAVEGPIMNKTKEFDFYSPNVSQKINRRNRKVTGNKVFSYFGIPNEPGAFHLGDYFNWVFFNPKSGEYDTLSAKYSLAVHGESRKNESIQATDLGSFYDKISLDNNTLESADSLFWVKILANIFILASIVITAIFVFKK